MRGTQIMARVVLAAGALLGVMLGLLLPAPALHGGPLLRPGYSAQ
jgi:hypothetical protein